MRLGIGHIFAEFGRSGQQHNVIDIRNVEGKCCRITVGLLAETFDSALSFYILLSEHMMRSVQSSTVELTAWNIRRLVRDFDLTPEFPSNNKAVYPKFPSRRIGELLNLIWLATAIRIVGLDRGKSESPDISAHLTNDSLPNGSVFVIEKTSTGVSDFLCILSDSGKCTELVAFLRACAVDLKHPLIEKRLQL